MVSRFIDRGLERDHERAEDQEQQQRREQRSTIAMNSGSLLDKHVREVDRPGGEPADEHRTPVRCSSGGSTSSRRWLTRLVVAYAWGAELGIR